MLSVYNDNDKTSDNISDIHKQAKPWLIYIMNQSRYLLKCNH